jgi:hypothetical protein
MDSGESILSGIQGVLVVDPAIDFVDRKNEPKLRQVGGSPVEEVGAADEGGSLHFGLAAPDTSGLELEEFLVGGGELALHAGGMEADVVEGLEVGGVIGEDTGFKVGYAEEAPLEVDEFLGESGFGGIDGAEVVLDASGEGLVFGRVFVGKEDGFGGESVLERVPARAPFAVAGTRSGRVACVGNVGGGLGCSRHDEVL